MASIMCARRLWQDLGQEGSPSLGAGIELHGCVLGSWAAKRINRGRQKLVLALNDRTYLPVLFPLAPRKAFREHFAAALRAVLQDLQIPAEIAAREASMIQHLPLSRLSNRSIAGSLNDLEFLCQCDLDYMTDLREVQLRLTDVPHVKRTSSIPFDAVRLLLAGEHGGPQHVH